MVATRSLLGHSASDLPNHLKFIEINPEKRLSIRKRGISGSKWLLQCAPGSHSRKYFANLAHQSVQLLLCWGRAVEGVAGSMVADAPDDGLEAFPAASISGFFLMPEGQHINSIVRRHKTVEGYIAGITELDYQFT